VDPQQRKQNKCWRKKKKKKKKEEKKNNTDQKKDKRRKKEKKKKRKQKKKGSSLKGTNPGLWSVKALGKSSINQISGDGPRVSSVVTRIDRVRGWVPHV